MIRSRYNIVHASAAAAALLFVIFAQGFAAFWKQFIHGINLDLNPTALLQTFALTAAIFGSLCLVLWLSTLFTPKKDRDDGGASVRGSRWAMRSVAIAARWSPLIIAIALGLNWLCSAGIEWLTGVQPSDQELVKCFAGDACPLGMRIVLGLLVLFEAPLLEEPLFRGIIFRGLASSLPAWAAMAISGFLFAIVHVNAASFAALWFLGIAFAELYRRTGTILAPMTAHALFNAANLALLPFLAP